jgi:hypothetical protein
MAAATVVAAADRTVVVEAAGFTAVAIAVADPTAGTAVVSTVADLVPTAADLRRAAGPKAVVDFLRQPAVPPPEERGPSRAEAPVRVWLELAAPAAPTDNGILSVVPTAAQLD